MKAKIRYCTITGRILEGNFGNISAIGDDEAIIELSFIPDPKTKTIVDGEVVNIAPPPTQIEVVQSEVRPTLDTIPTWATFSADEANDWIETNVTDLASAKAVIQKMAKLLCALRDHNLPGLRANK